MGLHISIFGSSTFDGLPKWNCFCKNCTLARARQIPPATTTSIAASGNGSDWLIVDASPEMRLQLANQTSSHDAAFTPVALLPLRPALGSMAGIGHAPDATLLALPEVAESLDRTDIFDTATRARSDILPEEPREIAAMEIRLLRLPDAHYGVELIAGDRRAYYLPRCTRIDAALLERVDGADLLIADGRDWASASGGALPISGLEGSLATWSTPQIKRRVFIGIDHQNPVLRPDSRERQSVEALGWRIAYDGMRLTL